MKKDTLDRFGFVPYLMESITNRIGANASRVFQAEYGIGLAEFRALSTLAILGSATASKISDLSGVDAGAISRSLFSLTEGGYIVAEIDPADRRQKALTITAQGWRVHAAVLERALLEERKLLADLSAQERAMLIKLLQKLYLRLFGERSGAAAPNPPSQSLLRRKRTISAAAITTGRAKRAK